MKGTVLCCSTLAFGAGFFLYHYLYLKKRDEDKEKVKEVSDKSMDKEKEKENAKEISDKSMEKEKEKEKESKSNSSISISSSISRISSIGKPHPYSKDMQQKYKDCIYMDYNATTPVYAEVFEAMRPFLTACFGNPSSSHCYSKPSKEAIKQARLDIGSLIMQL